MSTHRQASGPRADWTPLLLFRERNVLKQLKQLYRHKFRRDPEGDAGLFIHLGDSASRKCWSATSRKLPTFRTGGGKIWSVSKRRWLLGREKACALGFPAHDQVATTMAVAPFPLLDGQRAHHIAGNSMHFATAGVVQMVALSSFARV